MQPRYLGDTGVRVSPIALGTVELGMDYGFRGSHRYRRPAETDAVRIVEAAIEQGIQLIDTAPGYGCAERIVGAAIGGCRHKPSIATKVTIPEQLSGTALAGAVHASIEASLRALGVETIDLLQIHNTSSAMLARSDVSDVMSGAVDSGKVRCWGASVYGEQLAGDAARHPSMRAIQVPYNLLDQQMARDVFPLAARLGRGVLVRSAFLRGVLTRHMDETPAALAPIREAAQRAFAATGTALEDAASLALRYCLSNLHVTSVIVGVRTMDELEENLRAAALGPLGDGVAAGLEAFSMSGHPMITPQSWSHVI